MVATWCQTAALVPHGRRRVHDPHEIPALDQCQEAVSITTRTNDARVDLGETSIEF